MEGEKFLIHVATCIEQQLQKWDKEYQVVVMKLRDYEIMISLKKTSYSISVSEGELMALQNHGPYALDKKIWRNLEEQGLEIIYGYGNYLDNVYPKRGN